VGVLYSVTTISGPPLAIMLNNQGFVKQEFRAGLSLVGWRSRRSPPSRTTFAGIYTLQSFKLIPFISRASSLACRSAASSSARCAGNVPADLHELRRLDRRFGCRACCAI
jgi:hypothetical protein